MTDHIQRLPGIVARDLSPDVQRRVWAHIKGTYPDYASALTDHPFIARLRAEFGASPVLPESLVREAKA